MVKTVTDINGNIYELDHVLGAGGQGAVFRVAKNDFVLVKTPKNEGEQILPVNDKKEIDAYQNRINYLIALGDIPHIARPLRMLSEPYLGYTLLLMSEMVPLADAMRIPSADELKEQSMSKMDYIHGTLGNGFTRKYVILKNLSRILIDLENRGIAYCDLSFNNVFVSKNSKDSEVWLIDPDNLHYQGDFNLCIGTPLYRAPEVAKGSPNTVKSDLFTFALIAFEYLTYSKPFIGELIDEYDDDGEDEGIETDAELGNIPWVGNEDDDSNSQNAGIPMDKVLTGELRELFRRTFEEGLTDPSARPSAKEWYIAFENAICLSIEGDFKEGWFCRCGREALRPYDEEQFELFITDFRLSTDEKGELCYRKIEYPTPAYRFPKHAHNAKNDNRYYKIPMRIVTGIADYDGKIGFEIEVNSEPAYRLSKNFPAGVDVHLFQADKPISFRSKAYRNVMLQVKVPNTAFGEDEYRLIEIKAKNKGSK